MDKLKLIKKLSQLGERQGDQALKAAEIIKEILHKNNVDFFVNDFFTYIPVERRVSLVVDGKKIRVRNSGFVSGKINSTDISSSLIPSIYLIDRGGINFNPLCRDISRSNFYFAPALAVNVKDLGKIAKAKNVKAKVEVKKQKVISEQILVGNKKNPEVIVFSHYDSIGTGAIDNASGTAVALSLLIKNKKSLRKVLYVFDGNEELSYDYPTYWGCGYRMFEKKYNKIMASCKRIVVIDSVGNGNPIVFSDEKILNLAFPIKNKKILKKAVTVGGDIDGLMKVYHSDLDVAKLITNNYLNSTELLISKLLK